MMCACALMEASAPLDVDGADVQVDDGAQDQASVLAATTDVQANAGAGVPEVLLFEKNGYLGAKVLISGGGRCNVTTGIFDVRKLLENYPRGAKFLMGAMFGFPPDKVINWFQTHGVKLKTEEDLRVFPRSDNGKDVVRVLEEGMKGVKVFLNANVADVKVVGGPRKGGGGGVRHFVLTLKDGKTFDVDKVVITSGGNAYSHTGSTGDGYAFAKALGHTITDLAPSLSSFVVEEKYVVQAAGVSFAKAQFVLKSFEGQRIFKRTGPFLFTHQGVSGPAIFALSSMSAYENYDSSRPMSLSINFFPDEKAADLEKRLCKLIEEHGKKRLINLLDLFLPKSVCQVFLEQIFSKNPVDVEAQNFLSADLIAAKINKVQRRAILNALQNFELRVIGRGSGDEFVTAGGVKLDEVNSGTMESKICPGLYFAGEILDVDGFTGGFNLQASWATGKLAGAKLYEKI